ncbi:MAG: type IV pilin protein [Pseudomonadota bacterium]
MYKTAHGFTLIELMTAIAVVGLLTAIALPNYTAYIARSNRNVAKGDLLELQQWMERNYTLTNSYATLPSGGALTSASLPFSASPRSSTSTKYNLSFSAGPTATDYTLQAVPTSSQNDPSCATLSITSAGVRGASGATGTTAINACWNR